jgi:hypothetical protein
MQPHASKSFGISGGTSHLPITRRLRTPDFTRLPRLSLVTALAALIVLPQIGLAAYAMASPAFRAALAAHPIAALELAAAFAFWAGLVCWPLRKIILALTSDPIIDIRDGEVVVIDNGIFTSGGWRLPLATYEGIAIRSRTSFGGGPHVALLVHPDTTRSLVLATAEQFGDGEVQELSRILGLPVLPGPRRSAGGPEGGHRVEHRLSPITT